MADESVTTKKADSFVELWGDISQLESILEVVNEDLIASMTEEESGERKHRFNRAHNLLGAAQGLAENLARATGVRS